MIITFAVSIIFIGIAGIHSLKSHIITYSLLPSSASLKIETDVFSSYSLTTIFLLDNFLEMFHVKHF